MVPLPANLRDAGTQDLFRGVLKDIDVPLPLSAAGLQASRLASCNDGSFVFATGSNVFQMSCSPPRKRTRPADCGDGSASNDAMLKRLSEEDASDPVVLEAVADDYIVPKPFSATDVQRFIPHCAHKSEIQSVVADDSRVASVDMFGRCIVTAEKFSSSASGVHKKVEQDGTTSSFVVPPVSISGGERGWAGIALKKKEVSAVAVARQHFRDVTLYDFDVPVRTIHSVLTPGAIGFCGEGNMIAVAEGSRVAFYDFRAGENGSCIGRKTAGGGRLLALDVSSGGGMLATGGVDRILHIFDTRTMTVRDRWPGCLKYECAGALLSKEMEGMAYVCSVDNEVACGAWNADLADELKKRAAGRQSLMISGANTKSPRRAFGFRGDVRLTGMTRRNVDGEEIAAISETGAFYLLRKRRE